MTEKKGKKEQRRRTQVKELPKEEKELNKEAQRKIKGGEWLMQPAGQAKPKPPGT